MNTFDRKILLIIIPLLHLGNVRVIRITESIEYDIEDNE